MGRLLSLVVIVGTMTSGFFPDKVRAATCTYDPGYLGAESGDFSLCLRISITGFTCTNACLKENRDKFWRDFDFDRDDWDEGFGYEAPCDVNRPLARTFSALYVLKYLADDFSSAASNNPLRWGYGFASSRIDELDGRCGSGRADSGAAATTYHGGLGDDRTVLKWPFFYGAPAIVRAALIVHEARHADGKSHDGGTRCGRGRSCDSSWSYNGANTYEVRFLWRFCYEGTRTTTAMKEWARFQAQWTLDEGFVSPPGYVVDCGRGGP
jgi:hypothetical protein